MNTIIVTAAYAVGIAALFVFNRDRSVRTSWALWIPVVWLLIGGSRNVSDWLQLGSPVDYNEQYLEGNPVDRNALTVLLAVGVAVLYSRARWVGTLLRANTPILLFFAYCAISILWSDYPYVGFKRWIRGVGDIVMVFVVLSDPNALAAIKRLYSRVALLFLPLSVLLIRYYPDLGRSYGRDGSRYWTGVASGKNGLGMICLIFGIASIWQFILALRIREDPHRKRGLFVHGIMIVLAVWLLWIADSKTSLASFVFGGGLIALTNFSKLFRKPAVLYFAVAAIAVASCSVLFLGVGASALETIGRDPTLTGRTDVWNLVLSFAENPWIGAGYENFWLGKRLADITRINGGINQAHNGYIEIYLNLGWIGVALLATLIITGYRRVVSGIRSDLDAGGLKVAYFVVAVVYNFTEGSFKMMSPVWFAFLLATTAVPHLPSRPTARKPPGDGFWIDLVATKTPFVQVEEAFESPWVERPSS